MSRETVDETIDRVASGMTMVPVDPMFATRLRPRLRESLRITTSVMAACGAAVVLAIAVGVSVFRSAESAADRLPDMAATKATAETMAEPARIAPGEPSPPPSAMDGAHERSTAHAYQSAESELVASAITALPAPAVLDLAHLQFEPLAVAPVNVSSLEIAELWLTDIGAANDPGR